MNISADISAQTIEKSNFNQTSFEYAIRSWRYYVYCIYIFFGAAPGT